MTRIAPITLQTTTEIKDLEMHSICFESGTNPDEQ